MSRLCWFLLFAAVVVHGTDGSACTGDLGFINPRYWPMLWNLPLGNASFVNVGIQTYNYEQAVVHTTNRQTMLFASPPNLYGTGSSYIRELSEIRGRDIKDIRFGYDFMAVLDYDGNVWTAGGNYCGQLSADRSSRTTFTRVNLPGRVTEIAVGQNFCVVLTTDGQLFSWGCYDDQYASLGYISSSSANPNPTSFTLGTGVSRPNKICCGEYACAVLTQHSEVYSWGYYKYIGRTGDNRVPGRVQGIPSDESIIKLSCGTYHTVAVSSTGRLYGWGSNAYGELLQSTSDETNATVLLAGVNDAVAGRFLTIVRFISGNSNFFGRYNMVDYRTGNSTTSQSPRDLMARSSTGRGNRSTTKGAVRWCS